jgi:hypothetical protein
MTTLALVSHPRAFGSHVAVKFLRCEFPDFASRLAKLHRSRCFLKGKGRSNAEIPREEKIAEGKQEILAQSGDKHVAIRDRFRHATICKGSHKQVRPQP